MTKYFLNSGGVDHSEDKGRRFFNEIVSGLGKDPRVLLCLFAQPEDSWEASFEEAKKEFRSVLENDVEPSFKLAKPEDFAQQVKLSDAIYIHGGDEPPLFKLLGKYDFGEIFKDKVVATNSASSNLISTYYFCVDRREVEEGLGILNIKFIPHYLSSYGVESDEGPVDWDKARQELENYKDKAMPVYALQEGDYEVFSV